MRCVVVIVATRRLPDPLSDSYSVLLPSLLPPYLEPDDGGLRAAVDEAVQPQRVSLQLVDRPRAGVHRGLPHHHRRAVVARVEGGREVAQRACTSRWKLNSLSRTLRLPILPPFTRAGRLKMSLVNFNLLLQGVQQLVSQL